MANNTAKSIKTSTTSNTSKTNTTITTTNITGDLGSNIVLQATISNTNNTVMNHGNIAVRINGKTIGMAKIHENSINYTLPLNQTKYSKNNYTLTYFYGGSTSYTTTNTSTTLHINGYTPVINITTSTAYLNDVANITVTITDTNGNAANNGNIGIKINGATYKVNGKAYIVSLSNKTATLHINTTAATIGSNNITITYSGNNQFNSIKTTFKNALTLVNKTRQTCTVDPASGSIGSTVTLKATFTTTSGEKINNQTTSIKINNKTIATTKITNNIATYNLTLSNNTYSIRTYNITFITGATKTLTSASANNILTVYGYTPVITINATNATYNGETVTITTTITNEKNIKTTSGTVQLLINNKNTTNTNKAYILNITNGTATFKVNSTAYTYGYNNITIQYSGNNQASPKNTTKTNAFYTEVATGKVTSLNINTNSTVRMGALRIEVTTNTNNKQTINTGHIIILLNNTQIANLTIKNNKTTTVYQVPTTYNGTYKVEAYYTSPGNTYQTQKTQKTITIGKPEIGLTVTAPKTANANKTINIQINNITNKTKTITNGNIIYLLNNNIIGNSTVTNGKSTFNYTIPTTMKGNYTLKAYYIDTNKNIKSAMTQNNITIKNNLTPTNMTNIHGLYIQQSTTISQENITAWQNAGITDVFVQTNAQTNNTTKLEEVIKLCKNTDIKVHAWITCFYTNNKFNISTTQQNIIANFVTKTMKISGVDGISLDYIRYPGTNITQTNATKITNFVQRINTIIKSYDKSIILSASVFAEKEATTTYYGQNYTALSQYLDLIIPMAYRYDYHTNTTWITNVTNYVVKQATHSSVVTAIQTYNQTQNNLLNQTQLENDATAAINGESNGYILFRYDLINNYPNPYNITKS